MGSYAWMIALGCILGTLARFIFLNIDYRQYPSYPQGYMIHMTLGFIAAGLGAVAIPALLQKEFAAITFLALAAQQFREVRNMERQTLEKLDEMEIVPRGSTYIEGIAKVFEARNYLAMLVALSATGGALLLSRLFCFGGFLPALGGLLCGLLIFGLIKGAMRGENIGKVAEVRQGKVHFQGPLLMVEDIAIMNVGLKAARERYEKEALGVIIEPKNDNAREYLTNLGQRQALVHDVAVQLGVRKEVDEPEFTPLARRDTKTGRVGLVVIPIEPDIEPLLRAVRNVPVLEGAKRKPLDSPAGRAAAD